MKEAEKPLVLYRKYRPQTFDQVVGQEHIVTTLLNALKNGHAAHAYLFTGPRGTGKTSIARILAKAVNCLSSKDGEPCGQCANCQAITDQSAIDLIEIDAASHTQVEKMRDLIEKVHFAPTDLKQKVYLIDEVHMLSQASFNALLKTLEEPPEHTLFIMATTEIHKVPETVISRTQRFDFKLHTTDDLAAQLMKIAKSEDVSIDKRAVELIAAAAEGGMRDALSLLDQLKAYSGDKISYEAAEQLLGVTDYESFEVFTDHLASGRTKEAILFVNNLVAEGYDLTQFAKGEVEYLRQLLLTKLAQVSPRGMTQDRVNKLSELALLMSRETIVGAIELIQESIREFKLSPLPQLPLELAIIKLLEATESKAIEMQKPAAGDASAKKNFVPEIESQKTNKAQPVEPIAVSTEPKALESEPTASTGDDFLDSAKWEEFIGQLRSRHSSLAASLLLSDASLSGEELTLIFDYKFHKERLDERKNRSLVEELFEQVVGQKVRIMTGLKERPMPRSTSQIEAEKKEDILATVNEIFGGEIVEE